MALKLSTLLLSLHHKLSKGYRGVAGFIQHLELNYPLAARTTSAAHQLWAERGWDRTEQPPGPPSHLTGWKLWVRLLTKEGPGGTNTRPPGPENYTPAPLPGRRPQPWATRHHTLEACGRSTPDQSPAAGSSLPGVISGPPVGKAV